MSKVERGEDPIAVMRDQTRNMPTVQIQREADPFRVSAGDNDAFAARHKLGTALV